MALNLGTRTSTNTLVGSLVGSPILYQILETVTAGWPALHDLIATPQFAGFLTAAVAWLVARLSKTPENPGVV